MIQRLTREQIAKYKDKSQMAINGLNLALNQCEQIANLRDINQKWKYIAECMGLTQERGNSYYNTFIASKKDIMFLIRNANHNNTNEDLYNMHEQLGRPNKRYNIIFKHNSVFSDTSSTFLEAEHHVIFYQANSLDTSEDVKLYIQSLINLFENGETIFPKLPSANRSEINQNVQHNQTKENIIMKTNKVRLTESQLNRVIKESVKQVLSELDWKTYANAARKASFGDDRMKKFADKACEEFNKKYGLSKTYNPEDGAGIIKADIGMDRDNIFHKYYYGNIPIHYTKRMSNIPVEEWDEDWVDYDTDEVTSVHRKKYDDRNVEYNPGKPLYDEEYEGHPDAEDVLNHWYDANTELDAYGDGEYKYIKGNGWQKIPRIDSFHRALYNSLIRDINAKTKR